MLKVSLFSQKDKQLGETCGACFNPDINNDCGKCAPNLACQSADPRLPDLPGKCVKEEDLKGNSKKLPNNNPKIYILTAFPY